MRRRWSTIIVMGWYLMGPPIDKGVVQPDAPLKTWSHVEGFDSARECEASQFVKTQQAYEALRKVLDAVGRDRAKPDETYLAASAKWAVAARSQCIDSSDPRLR